MATNTVTASAVVSFNDSTQGSSLFNAQVDDRQDGPNAGRTSFYPGDTVYLLLFKSSNVVVDYYASSSGSLISLDSANYPVIDQYLVFAGEPEASVSLPINNGFSYSWMGNDLGNVVVENETVVRLTSPQADGRYAGVLKLNYISTGQSFALSNTLIGDETEFQIVNFFMGHTA